MGYPLLASSIGLLRGFCFGSLAWKSQAPFFPPVLLGIAYFFLRLATFHCSGSIAVSGTVGNLARSIRGGLLLRFSR